MIYLSGPITNKDPKIQQWNLDNMNAKAKELRAKGLTVFNPAELEEEAKEWGYYLARDLKWIFENKPDFYFMKGWKKSLGCKLEHEAYKLLGTLADYE